MSDCVRCEKRIGVAELGQIKGKSLSVRLLSHFHCCFGSGRVNTVNEVSLKNKRHLEKEMKRLWVEKLKKLFRVALKSLSGFFLCFLFCFKVFPNTKAPCKNF